MTPPLSLPMLKMEKNFVAYIDKKYPRKPYEEYPITDLSRFVTREQLELSIALVGIERIKCLRAIDPVKTKLKEVSDQILAAMWEVADVSNTLDYLFEGLLKEYTGLEDEIE